MSLLPIDVGLKNLEVNDEEIVVGFLGMFSQSCPLETGMLYTSSSGVTTEYGLRYHTMLAGNQIVSDKIGVNVQQTILLQQFCSEFSSYAERFNRAGGMIIPHKMEINPRQISMMYYGVMR